MLKVWELIKKTFTQSEPGCLLCKPVKSVFRIAAAVVACSYMHVYIYLHILTLTLTMAPRHWSFECSPAPFGADLLCGDCEQEIKAPVSDLWRKKEPPPTELSVVTSTNKFAFSSHSKSFCSPFFPPAAPFFSMVHKRLFIFFLKVAPWSCCSSMQSPQPHLSPPPPY